MKGAELKNIKTIWPKVSNILSLPRNEREYKKLRNLLDQLIDEIGENESHPLASLMDTIGVLISEYEDSHYPVKDAKGVDALKYLMKEHGLKQSDLHEIGSQGVVSEILNGKRELNIRQIKLLSEKFFVTPSVFI